MIKGKKKRKKGKRERRRGLKARVSIAASDKDWYNDSIVVGGLLYMPGMAAISIGKLYTMSVRSTSPAWVKLIYYIYVWY